MTRRYFSRIGSLILTAFLLSGIAMMSGSAVQAQGRGHRRVVIVQPFGFYRPFGPYRRWNGYPYGYNPYAYSQYVFRTGDVAADQGYEDGYKTGADDGHKAKSFSAERSHYFHDAGFGNFAGAYREGFVRGYRQGYDSERNG